MHYLGVRERDDDFAAAREKVRALRRRLRELVREGSGASTEQRRRLHIRADMVVGGIDRTLKDCELAKIRAPAGGSQRLVLEEKYDRLVRETRADVSQAMAALRNTR